MSKSLEVQLDDKVIVIKKLPIMRYAEMLKVIKELPKHIGTLDLQNITIQTLVQELPLLIGVALPDILNIIEIATELERKEIEKLGLTEITKIVVAIYETNNYQELFDTLKKVTAQPKVLEAQIVK